MDHAHQRLSRRPLLPTLFAALMALAACSGAKAEKVDAFADLRRDFGAEAAVDLAADSEARSFFVGQRSLAFSHPDGAALQAELYYPATRQGRDAEVAPGLFPLVIVAHGYGMNAADYVYVAEFLAREGYVVALPAPPDIAATIDVDRYGSELLALLDRLHALGREVGSPFFERVDVKSALMGHSTGAGASVVAAAAGDHRGHLTAVVALAPLAFSYGPITGTDGLEAAPQVTVPTLVLEGAEDCICPPARHARPLYEALAGPTQLVSFTTGDHCGFVDARGPHLGVCEVGELALCAALLRGPTLSVEQQNRLTERVLGPWLAHHLKGDPDAWSAFVAVADDPRIELVGP